MSLALGFQNLQTHMNEDPELGSKPKLRMGFLLFAGRQCFGSGMIFSDSYLDPAFQLVSDPYPDPA